LANQAAKSHYVTQVESAPGYASKNGYASRHYVVSRKSQSICESDQFPKTRLNGPVSEGLNFDVGIFKCFLL